MIVNSMLRYLFLALLFLCISGPLAASPGNYFLQLEQGKLTAKIEEKKILKVLLDLAEKGNFGLQCVGEIDTTISAEFKEKDLISGLKDILRLAGLSYIMVKKPGSFSSPEEDRLYTLLVCVGDDQSSGYQRETRSSQQREARHPPREQFREGPSSTGMVAAAGEHSDAVQEKRIEFEGSREDLRQFVDNLVQEGNIKPEEYENIVHIMNQKNQTE